MSCLAEYAAALAAQNHELQPESSFPMLTLPLSSFSELLVGLDLGHLEQA